MKTPNIHRMVLTITALFVLGVIPTFPQTYNRTVPNMVTPAGLQVNTLTGNLFYQRHELHIPSVGPDLEIYFSYNSYNTKLNFGYGYGWTMNYNMLYETLPDTVVIHREDGRRDTFPQVLGYYVAPPGVFDTLILYDGDKYLLRSKYGTECYFEDPGHKRLTKKIDRNGNTLTVTYAGGLPSFVTDATGRTLAFTFTDSLLTSITDNNTPAPRILSYAYNGGKKQVCATDPLGHAISYAYNIDRKMVQLTDKRGNTYDIEYMVNGHISEITSQKSHLSMSYPTPGVETSASQLVRGSSQVSLFDFDNQGRNIQMTNQCCGYDISFTYDGDHNYNSIEDAAGYASNFNCDDRGNYLTTTDPLGQTVSTSYDPSYSLPTRVIDPKGYPTDITRDPQGNVLQVKAPQNRISNYTYYSNGLVKTSTDPNGNTTTYLYNAFGYLVEVQYPIGTAEFEYDNAGRLLYSVTPEGDTSHMEYNLNNWITQVKDPLGNITKFEYNQNGDLVQTINARGFPTTIQYNYLGQPVKVTDALGNVTQTSYDVLGNVLKQIDPRGNPTSYDYNSRNLLTSVTNATGNSMHYTYDANGNLETETDYLGNQTQIEYDSLNRVVKIIDALLNETMYSYDLNGNLDTLTDANGNFTEYLYDSLNQVYRINYPIGYETFTYDFNGNRKTATDANFHTTTFFFNEMNWLDSIMDPMSFVNKYTYNLNGSMLTSTNPNSHTTTYGLDKLERMISMINAESEATSYTYNPMGSVTEVSYPNGNTVTTIYDALERQVHSYDIVGPIAYLYYDENSNITYSKDANGNGVHSTYDQLNRVFTVTDALGVSSQIDYDVNSNVIEQTDRNGNTTKYQYDALNRQTELINALNDTTRTDYDAVGNVQSMKDAKGNVTTYSYDNLYRLTQETFADATFMVYSYDDGGNLVYRVDNNGDTTFYNYDANDRLSLRNYPDTNDDWFVYDDAGRMLSATNNNAVITYTYDDVDRILSETLNGVTTGYAYDIPNRVRTLQYPSGRTIDEVMDPRNRLAQIFDGGDLMADFAYDNADRLLTRAFPQNGTSTHYHYNANDWITRLTHNPGAFVDFAYTHDNEGNRLLEEHLHWPEKSMQAEYDDIYRLVDYKRGVVVGSSIPTPLHHDIYNYDKTGNRTTATEGGVTYTYTANNMHEYTSIANGGVTIPTYDLNGNMLTDGTYSYKYDFENRMDSVDNGVTATYSYDPLGRRITKRNATDEINFYYDGHRVLEERDDLNNPQATYVFGSWIDDVLNMERSGNDYFYHQNSLGSVSAISNMSTNVEERYSYEAYGTATITDGLFGPLSGSLLNNEYLLTGRRIDEETELYYYRSRHYNAGSGRFYQRDLLGYADALNLYQFVGNNPLNRKDPFGLQGNPDVPEWWFTAGGNPEYDELFIKYLRWRNQNPNPKEQCRPPLIYTDESPEVKRWVETDAQWQRQLGSIRKRLWQQFLRQGRYTSEKGYAIAAFVRGLKEEAKRRNRILRAVNSYFNPHQPHQYESGEIKTDFDAMLIPFGLPGIRNILRKSHTELILEWEKKVVKDECERVFRNSVNGYYVSKQGGKLSPKEAEELDIFSWKTGFPSYASGSIGMTLALTANMSKIETWFHNPRGELRLDFDLPRTKIVDSNEFGDRYTHHLAGRISITLKIRRTPRGGSSYYIDRVKYTRNEGY